MYQSLYRKYRPKTFDDVVGQEHITTTLKNEIAASKPAHAYLFTGSRGTGKTSCSKIFAKAVNCPNQTDGNPCCTCDICIGIEDGAILDVLEIDAASNNGVDNIRDLREEANFTPAVTKYRVYIIDETHMLSPGAFNALLKIMEEPPAHVIFILATTEVHKVPATILSRCQRFDFRRIASDTIKDRLLYVAQQEEISLEEDAAKLIAKLSDGGMRDALSLMDLCSSHSKSITSETVANAAGIVGREHLFDLDTAISGQDTGAALAIVSRLNEKSLDPERLLGQLITHYRDLMIARSVKNPEDLIAALPTELETLMLHSKAYELAELTYILSVLQDSLGRISRTSQRKTELEMTLIKLCDAKLVGSYDALLARIAQLETAVKSGVVKMTAAPSPALTTAGQASESKQASSQGTPAEPAAQSEEEKPIPKDIPLTEITPFSNWIEVLARLEKLNGALYGALAGSKAFLNGDILLIDCKNSMFLQLIRDSEHAKQSIRQAAAEVTGKKFRLGPYKQENYKIAKEEKDPLEDFISNLSMDEDKLEIR